MSRAPKEIAGSEVAAAAQYKRSCRSFPSVSPRHTPISRQSSIASLRDRAVDLCRRRMQRRGRCAGSCRALSSFLEVAGHARTIAAHADSSLGLRL